MNIYIEELQEKIEDLEYKLFEITDDKEYEDICFDICVLQMSIDTYKEE